MPANFNGRGGPKKLDGKITEKFRDACPPHKVKDLDALVKLCKGDEVKIHAKITEWWEEPQVEEPQWEAVGKVNKKTPVSEKKEKAVERGGDRGGLRGDGGRGRGGGSGGGRRESGGGRDGSRKDGRGAGRGGGAGRNGDRDRSRGGDTDAPNTGSAPKPKEEPGIPTPVTNVQGPKGAWGGGQTFAAAAAASSILKPTPAPAIQTAQAPPVTQTAAAPKEQAPIIEPDEAQVDLGSLNVHEISPADPMPSGLLTPAVPLSPPPKTTGNVWGTKGGAHLIQAEKKPISAPVPLPPSPEVVEPDPIEPEPDFLSEPEADNSFVVSLDSVLPPSVNGANINASGWEPMVESNDSLPQQPHQQTLVGISQPSPASAAPEPEPPLLPTPTTSAAQTAAPAPASGGLKSNSVLNMGHWETGDGEDDLDFGFGSFGAPENDTDISATETAKSTAANASASPARPPPGLSMPPMPAGAMLVHELENKLEAAALAPKVDNNNGSDHATTQPSQPQLFMNPSGMSQYGGMGMYNIPPPGMHNGLSSMSPGQFPLDSGVNQQQLNIQLNNSRPGNPPSQLNQAGQQLQQGYGMQPTASASNTSGAPSNETPNASGMPSGMPSMQYPNPAYMYAAGAVPGQFNQMGHPAYGMQAAAYGYGQQFPPQGGHQYGGYNQGLMGQGGGYGVPQHYDDQRGGPRGGAGGNMRDDNQGGYKGGGRGGYRGNRNHHQNSHQTGYGNNYPANPNLGGYGAGPYNMGYGGYGNPGGPSGMDHYSLQQHQQGGGGYSGFPHQDNDHKKSLGPNGSNQPAGGFQQQSHLHQQQLGLQGTSTDAGAGAGVSGGWPGSRQQNWGGDWQQES